MNIKKIRIKQQNGESAFPNSALLIPGQGIECDTHKASPDREISILDERSSQAIKNLKGLCTQRFQENITYEGEVQDFIPGGVYQLGDAKITITQIGKRCFDECPLYQAGIRCCLPYNLLFASVNEQGTIKTGDEFVIIK